jgi:asparagine synthetase B (glutamine-hydrolysing)
MHMFFAALAKGGHAISELERDTMIARIRRAVVFSAYVARVEHIAPTLSSLVVGVSNEPSGGWYETDENRVFLCGYCSDEEALVRLTAARDLAEQSTRVAGRFSLLVAAKRQGRFALATQPARVDSIFRAENDRYVFWGNQASVLSALRDGEVRHAPDRLLTLINSGFFGDDSSPYKGVETVKAFTTILVTDDSVAVSSRCLSSLKRRPSISGRFLPARLPNIQEEVDQHLETLTPHFIRSFAPLRPADRIDLGLTGGMDSRLLLAGGLAGGLTMHCFTRVYGEANRADVWLARKVAELTGVDHRWVDVAAAAVEPSEPAATSLLRVARSTLAATDGMLGVQYPVTPVYRYQPRRGMSGQGGEILRGGYGEKVRRPTREDVLRHMRGLWNHSPRLFHPHLVDEQEARHAAYVASFPDWVMPEDILDCLYVDQRCGRWASAATAASTTRIRPLLDNVVVRDALAISTQAKRTHLVHRRLIERLLPWLADVPLANRFWHGTSDADKTAIASAWPAAFSKRIDKSAGGHAVRELDPEKEQVIRRYVVDEGRLDVLEDVVRVDEVLRYLNAPPDDHRPHDRLLMGLFTATVLLCEPWRPQHSQRKRTGTDPRPVAPT